MALLYPVIEITTLHPTGMFAEQGKTQSDTPQPSDHYKINLSASGAYHHPPTEAACMYAAIKGI